MEFETIPVKELDRYVREGRIIIDLRTPREYRAEHILGALNLPYEQLEDKISSLPDEELILYCERGSASMAAARELAARNYRVKTVVGGIRAYRGRNKVSIDRGGEQA